MSLLLPGPKAYHLHPVGGSVNPYRPSIKTHWLQYFVAIVHHGHIGSAAQAMEVTVQAMHHNLNQLETFVGADLLIREGGALQLTPTGDYLFHTAIELLQNLQQIGGVPLVRKHLTVAYVDTGFTQLWAALFQHLRQIYPEHYLRGVAVTEQASLEDQLCEGQVDLALLPHPPQRSELLYQASMSYPYVIVSAPQERMAWGQFTYVCLNHPDADPWNQTLFPRRIQISVGHLQTLRQMLSRGHHAAYLPTYMIASELSQGALQIVADAPQSQFWQNYLCWHRDDDQQAQWQHVAHQLWPRDHA